MKKIIYLFIILIGVSFTACKESTEGISKVTTYATMTLNGDDPLFWNLGTTFVDPGCVAIEGTTDISSSITTASDININSLGRYTITYNVLNSDGFAATKTRTVYVCNTSDTRNGYYKSSIKRSYNGGAYTSRGTYSILILGNGSNQLWVEDLIGGWYWYGSGYGIAYSTSGKVNLNTTIEPNLVTGLQDVTALPWGYTVVPTTAEPSSYTTATKTLILNDEVTGLMKFRVTYNNPTSIN